VVRLLRRVDMDVYVFDPYLSDEDAREMNAKKVESLDELLTSCRIISMHAPATPTTHHMIGRANWPDGDGAMFINTGRSWTVDGDALLAELRTGRISAAIDVFDEEPLPVESGISQAVQRDHHATSWSRDDPMPLPTRGDDG